MSEGDLPVTHDDAQAIRSARLAAVPVDLPMLADAGVVLAMDDTKEEIVPVPEWGFRCRVVSLTGKQRDDFELAMIEGRGKNRQLNLRNMRAKLVALSIRHPENREQRIFNDQQIVALGDKNAGALQRVFEVAQKLSNLSDEDVDELTATLGEDQSAASGSD